MAARIRIWKSRVNVALYNIKGSSLVKSLENVLNSEQTVMLAVILEAALRTTNAATCSNNAESDDLGLSH